MRRRRLISGLLALLVLCAVLTSLGCELVGTQDAWDETYRGDTCFAGTYSSTRRPHSLLGYYSWVQQCSTSELMKEYAWLERKAADDGAQGINLRLALLLSLPEEPFSDDVRARLILKRYLDTNTNLSESEDEAFALFLLELLKERERYESRVKTLESQIEDYHVVMNELQKERALRSKLELQVQQLKNIEEILIEQEKVKLPPSTN